MKIFYLILFAFNMIYAQDIKGVIYKNLLSEDGKSTMYFDQDRSLYIAESKKYETSVKRMPDGSLLYPVNTVDSIANKPRFVYYDNKNKVFYNNIINNDIETILHDKVRVNWVISDERKEILNFQCQKAIGELPGVAGKYIVWYTKELPLPYGPFKFNGLEGTILELYTADNKIHLIADSMIYGEAKIDDFISKYDFSKSVSRETYKKNIEKQMLDFENKLNNTLPEGRRLKLKKEICRECNK